MAVFLILLAAAGLIWLICRGGSLSMDQKARRTQEDFVEKNEALLWYWLFQERRDKRLHPEDHDAARDMRSNVLFAQLMALQARRRGKRGPRL